MVRTTILLCSTSGWVLSFTFFILMPASNSTQRVDVVTRLKVAWLLWLFCPQLECVVSSGDLNPGEGDRQACFFLFQICFSQVVPNLYFARV